MASYLNVPVCYSPQTGGILRWSRGRRHQQHGPDQLLHQATDGAGEGVPLQQVPHPGQAHRDSRRPSAQRNPGTREQH